MTQYLLYVTRGGSVSVQTFSSAFVRGLAVIALAHQPVVVTTADVDPEA